MTKVTLQNIENIKIGLGFGNKLSGISEFTMLLCCELALSKNISSESNQYKKMRAYLQDGRIEYAELLDVLCEDSEVKVLFDLFPKTDDANVWKTFLKKCIWFEKGDKNCFSINGQVYETTRAFLKLVEHDSKYYAYKYDYDDETDETAFVDFNLKKYLYHQSALIIHLCFRLVQMSTILI